MVLTMFSPDPDQPESIDSSAVASPSAHCRSGGGPKACGRSTFELEVPFIGQEKRAETCRGPLSLSSRSYEYSDRLKLSDRSPLVKTKGDDIAAASPPGPHDE
jgi:hypothetical protein